MLISLFTRKCLLGFQIIQVGPSLEDFDRICQLSTSDSRPNCKFHYNTLLFKTNMHAMQEHTSSSNKIVVILVGSVVPLPSTILDGGVTVVGYREVKQTVTAKGKLTANKAWSTNYYSKGQQKL